VKKATPAKKAVSKPTVKAVAKKAEIKAPAKPASKAAVSLAKKKADKNKDVQASHHGRIVTKAEVAAFQNQAEASGHVIRKSHFSSKMKKHYRDLLLDLRAGYMDQLNIHRADALTNRKSGPGAGMATHMADLGSDNFQHDFELGLLSDEGTVIEMIDEALTRLDENEYGICMECGKEIGAARLAVKPFARFCVACKSRKEATERSDRRYR
jgi:DnaK suppressor protein